MLSISVSIAPSTGLWPGLPTFPRLALSTLGLVLVHWHPSASSDRVVMTSLLPTSHPLQLTGLLNWLDCLLGPHTTTRWWLWTLWDLIRVTCSSELRKLQMVNVAFSAELFPSPHYSTFCLPWSRECDIFLVSFCYWVQWSWVITGYFLSCMHVSLRLMGGTVLPCSTQ